MKHKPGKKIKVNRIPERGFYDSETINSWTSRLPRFIGTSCGCQGKRHTIIQEI